MFHADANHSGRVTGSDINSQNAAQLAQWKDLQLGGPILSTPAVVDGSVYVGIANSQEAAASNGGQFHKVDIEAGEIVATYRWDIPGDQSDTHGFCGMGCTPAVTRGSDGTVRVVWSAFDGKLYCLDGDLNELWITDLRASDAAHNQPVNNVLEENRFSPKVAGWSSPLVVGDKVYVGMGEGENPKAYGIIYCLDITTGNVTWLFCTAQFQEGVDNQPNVVPDDVALSPLPAGFTTAPAPDGRGCSVWSSPAYDETLGRIYCATGNPTPDGPLPTAGYSNGILCLDAATGEFVGFTQFPVESSYRPSDIDVDIGGAPTVFTDGSGRRVVGVGCKNGSYMILDADSLELITWRQMLPKTNDEEQIPTVDPHFPESSDSSQEVPNSVSNATQAENYFGTYSTAAVDPTTGKLFIGIGGNNSHPEAPGIDTPTTPFLRCMDWQSLDDAWPLDDGDPQRYAKCKPPMYTTGGESGLAVPAVVNDVVVMSTSAISVYVFAVADGTPLFSDQLGAQTSGLSGGYGYCLGPAVWGNYIVAGALVRGRDGGLLRIYKLPDSSS
jgi:hypothetical protein